MRSIVKQFVDSDVNLPAELWNQVAESATCAPYLVSCFARPGVLYVSERFRAITGYPGARFIDGGAQFWFSLIHTPDMQGVVSRISKAEHELLSSKEIPPGPLELEYRIKRADGSLLWIRELKAIISWRDGSKDHILGCIRDISAEKIQESSDILKLLKREPETHGLLETALSFQLPASGDANKSDDGVGKISPREAEVLRLVAAGSSSKQIADQLSISENTVETHRRNLLKKFKVNNSTALVNEAIRRGLI